MVLPFRFDGLDIRALRLLGDLGQVVPFKVDFKDQDSIKRAVRVFLPRFSCLIV